jgi:hypothetical protein
MAELPPTQYLIMEVLAARARTGEQLWTFPSNLAVSLRALEDRGLISVMHGVAPGSLRASLTVIGRAETLKDDYETPLAQKVLDAVEEGMRSASTLLAKLGTDQAVEQGLGVAYAIPKVKAHVRGALGITTTGSNPSSGGGA